MKRILGYGMRSIGFYRGVPTDSDDDNVADMAKMINITQYEPQNRRRFKSHNQQKQKALFHLPTLNRNQNPKIVQ